jgi:hypothetical protein
VVPLPRAAAAAPTAAELAAEAAAQAQTAKLTAAHDAVTQSSDQLDKFQKVYEDATKIFGAEHTVISPSFFFASDIKGRLDPTEKRETGLSATLLLPLFGAGGGHGADWFPVVTSSDETQIYQAFLDQLDQYQQAEANFTTISGSVDAITQTKWNIQNLLAAKQIFCKEELEWPAGAEAAIQKLCHEAGFTTITPTTVGGVTTATPSADQTTVINALGTAAKAGQAAPKRHNLLLGPSLGIPLTKNPTDIFQLGASVEVGGDAFRMMATGGLVGRYQGATWQDVFAAGWFVGVALSGQLGDELFHYFNGGSDLLNQLAQIKNNPTPAD